jgi:hypothetical protein
MMKGTSSMPLKKGKSQKTIEVTGEFTLDNKGFPLKLTNVFRIEPVSLGSIKLPELRWKNRTFKFNQPMEFTPSLDSDTQQLYVIEDASLGVNVFSETREGLLQELSEQIAMLWDEYADEKDENLAEDALAVAKKLRHAIKVSGNACRDQHRNPHGRGIQPSPSHSNRSQSSRAIKQKSKKKKK